MRGAELIRSTEEEKQDQVAGVRDFQARHAAGRARRSSACRQVAAAGGNVFAELMETVKVCSLGPDLARALRSRRAVPPQRLADYAGWRRRRAQLLLSFQVRLTQVAGARVRRAASRQLRAPRPGDLFAAPGSAGHSTVIGRGRRNQAAVGQDLRAPRITAGTTGQSARDGRGERAGMKLQQSRPGRERAFGKEHQRLPLARRVDARAGRPWLPCGD